MMKNQERKENQSARKRFSFMESNNHSGTIWDGQKKKHDNTTQKPQTKYDFAQVVNDIGLTRTIANAHKIGEGLAGDSVDSRNDRASYL